MNRLMSLFFVFIIAVCCLCACENKSSEKDYYPGTELDDLETFTSITGIELNISQDCPESNSVNYNYLMDNDASGLSAVTKYESYLKQYGFKKSEDLSDKDSTVYLTDDFLLITGVFNPQDNVIQYVVNIPNGKYPNVSTENDVNNEVKTPQNAEIPADTKDEAAIYAEFYRLVDIGNYTDAFSYWRQKNLSPDYADARDYYLYARAMKLYLETEFLNYYSIMDVIDCLSKTSEGFKDAAEIAEKINGELDRMQGIHISRLEGHEYGSYLIIDADGKVTLAFTESYEDAISYGLQYQLTYVNFEEGSSYMLCNGSRIVKDNCEYAITIQSEDIVLSKAWGAPNDGTFKGNYTKVSDDPYSTTA